jgi:hypothetical protein
MSPARSVRHRLSRRRRAAGPARQVAPPARPAGQVAVTVETATGLRQSFLIMNGETVGVQLHGYVTAGAHVDILTVPVVVQARII